MAYHKLHSTTAPSFVKIYRPVTAEAKAALLCTCGLSDSSPSHWCLCFCVVRLCGGSVLCGCSVVACRCSAQLFSHQGMSLLFVRLMRLDETYKLDFTLLFVG